MCVCVCVCPTQCNEVFLRLRERGKSNDPRWCVEDEGGVSGNETGTYLSLVSSPESLGTRLGHT